MINWIDGKPTTEGFYFCQCRNDNGSYVTAVRVYAGNGRQDQMTTVFWDGENVSIHDTRFLRWSERIPEPSL